MPEGSRWKLDDPKVLLDEIAAKRAAEAAKQAQKKQKAIKRISDAIGAAEQLLPDPASIFREQKDEDGNPKFGSFDDTGFPLTAADGTALAKGTIKKCQKTLKGYNNKRKAIEKKAKGSSIEEYIASLKAELAALTSS